MNSLFHLLIKMAMNIAGFSLLISGKIEQGMLFIISGQLMDVQMTLGGNLKIAISKDDLKKLNEDSKEDNSGS